MVSLLRKTNPLGWVPVAVGNLLTLFSMHVFSEGWRKSSRAKRVSLQQLLLLVRGRCRWVRSFPIWFFVNECNKHTLLMFKRLIGTTAVTKR